MPILARLLLAGLLALSSFSVAVPVSARHSVPRADATNLWIDLSMGPEYVDWFNRNTRTDDVARIDHLSMTSLLDEIETSRRLVVFKSIREAEETMPLIAGQVDIIGYNIEHGPANPQEEQFDPVDSVFHMSKLANQYGAQLAVGPDHDFAVTNGAEMAQYADIMILQVQRVQTDLAIVRDFVLPTAHSMRNTNPDIEISMQIGANGDPLALAELVQSMAGELDGVSILTDHESTDFVVDFVRELRGNSNMEPRQSGVYVTTYLVMTAVRLNMSIVDAIHSQIVVRQEKENSP